MTAGKDTADLICFQQTSSFQLIAIYMQRAKDDMHTKMYTETTHTHGLPLSVPGTTRKLGWMCFFFLSPWLGHSSVLALALLKNKNNNTSGSRSLTSKDLSDGIHMTGLEHAKLVKG